MVSKDGLCTHMGMILQRNVHQLNSMLFSIFSDSFIETLVSYSHCWCFSAKQHQRSYLITGATFHCVVFFFLIFICLTASGLSCGMRALCCGCRLLSSRGVQAQQLLRASLPHSMWDLSSWTRDQTCVPCIARQILNHLEVPLMFLWLVCVKLKNAFWLQMW